MRNLTVLTLILGVLGVASAGLSAESESKPVESKPKDIQSWATVEKIMHQAVRNIALRYNLNEEQTERTSELMQREVTRFLKEHEEEIWPVLRDLLTAQLKPPGEAQEAKRIGQAAAPLAKLAEQAIFAANEDWAHILTEDQKRLHQFDLAEMRKTFKKIHENFDNWSQGKPGDQGVFPPAEIPVNEPARPKKPKEGLPPAEVRILDISIFDTRVEEFIKDYELGKGQIDSARSILKDFKAKANNIRTAKKDDFAKVAAERSEALENQSRQGIRAAAEKHKKLLEPILALFGQMDTRLKGLLTTAQIERYAQKTAAAQADAKQAESKPKAVEAEPKASKAKSDTSGSKPKAGTPKKRRTVPKKPAAQATPKKKSGAGSKGDNDQS